MPVMLKDQLVGRRVVVRFRRADPGDQPPLSDVVGTLTDLTSETATVLSDAGPRVIDRQAVVAARVVAANRRDILELERISRLGWRAATRTEIDGWQVFADRGWTGRANSALPLAIPQRPLEAQLAELCGYYERRGLPPQIQVPLPARGLLDAELARRCWTLERPTAVLTRSLAVRPERIEPVEPATDFAAHPDADWVAAYHYRGGRLPDFAVELLTRHDHVTFASIRRQGRTVAIARGVLDDGWLGVTAVEVAAEYRRQGLARRIMQELLAWGVDGGASDCYLQLEDSNTAALALYRGLGFTEHHRYHYRVAPAASRRNPPAGPAPGSS